MHCVTISIENFLSFQISNACVGDNIYCIIACVNATLMINVQRVSWVKVGQRKKKDFKSFADIACRDMLNWKWINFN